jgi:hypothetical protein
MQPKSLIRVLTPILLLAASSVTIAGPTSVGELTGVTASKTQLVVGESVSISVQGTVQAGKSCHLSGGPATLSPNFLDFGLVSSFPTTLAKTFSFDKPGNYYIHVYSGTTDAEHYCAVSNTPGNHGSVMVTVTPKIEYHTVPTLAPATPVKIIPPLTPGGPSPRGQVVPPDPYRK